MSPALLVHIAGGGGGILCGTVALAVRKGGRTHRLAGTGFVAAMAAMGLAAAFLSLVLPDWANLPGALFALYLVLTGLTAFEAGEAGRRWAGAAGQALGGAAAGCALLLAFQAAAAPSGLVGGKPAPLFAIVAGLAAAALALDARAARGLDPRGRLKRHIWRMCTALFVATGSFFLGQQRVMPAWLQDSPALFVLALAPLALMAFWLARAAFRRAAPARA